MVRHAIVRPIQSTKPGYAPVQTFSRLQCTALPVAAF